MNTIQAHWEDFRKSVVPAEASPGQVRDMQRAFYGGAAAIMSIMSDIGTDDVSDDAGIQVLAGLEDELKRFTTRIGTDA